MISEDVSENFPLTSKGLVDSANDDTLGISYDHQDTSVYNSST